MGHVILQLLVVLKCFDLMLFLLLFCVCILFVQVLSTSVKKSVIGFNKVSSFSSLKAAIWLQCVTKHLYALLFPGFIRLCVLPVS